MITIVDYGMGNLKSVSKAFEKIGAEVVITDDKDVVEKAESIVLPGVGAFGDAMENLKELGLVDVLKRKARESIPFIGICLGMQLLFSESEEGGFYEGLDILKGKVVKFTGNVKVPHVGWNIINKTRNSPILEGITDGSYFYFVHSFYVKPQDKEKECVCAVTPYSIDFPSIVHKNNVIGVQFHPEKSSSKGMILLKNIWEMIRCS